jgi:hypothetical protein
MVLQLKGPALNKEVKMKKGNVLKLMVAIVMVGSLVGCATTETPPPAEPAFQPVELSTTTYDKKVDTFVVGLDSSSSMREAEPQAS